MGAFMVLANALRQLPALPILPCYSLRWWWSGGLVLVRYYVALLYTGKTAPCKKLVSLGKSRVCSYSNSHHVILQISPATFQNYLVQLLP